MALVWLKEHWQYGWIMANIGVVPGRVDNDAKMRRLSRAFNKASQSVAAGIAAQCERLEQAKRNPDLALITDVEQQLAHYRKECLALRWDCVLLTDAAVRQQIARGGDE